MPLVENVSRIEPCRLEAIPEALADRVATLVGESAVLGQSLHAETASRLSQLVRLMNCYYSNLIEGHRTRPLDIERALAGELDGERRDLQIEARAHVRVQAAVDQLAIDSRLPEPASREFIRWLHQEFYKDASPEALSFVPASGKAQQFNPGEFRTKPEEDVVVGRHHPPSSPRVEDFMRHFEWRFGAADLGKAGSVIAIAIAHHRLNYIHPFVDGNGRVSRLMSHAMALKCDIGSHGLWSISRGLARGLNDRTEYKRLMDHADMPRQGDLDGRGNLSQRALVDWVSWFLDVAIDQVRFMSSLFDFGTLRGRLQTYAERDLGLRSEAVPLLNTLLQQGTLTRGEASALSGLNERTARDLIKRLLDSGLVQSPSAKGPLFLRFGAESADVLFPRLFTQE